jgi:hypothetical protein
MDDAAQGSRQVAKRSDSSVQRYFVEQDQTQPGQESGLVVFDRPILEPGTGHEHAVAASIPAQGLQQPGEKFAPHVSAAWAALMHKRIDETGNLHVPRA